MKTFILIAIAVLGTTVMSQAQTTNFYTPNQIEAPTLKFNDFKSVPLSNLSLMKPQEKKGIPPALLIIGGAGLFLIGAGTPVQGDGTIQVLLMAGGLGLVSTGVVIAVQNSQNNQWE